MNAYEEKIKMKYRFYEAVIDKQAKRIEKLEKEKKERALQHLSDFDRIAELEKSSKQLSDEEIFKLHDQYLLSFLKQLLRK